MMKMNYLITQMQQLILNINSHLVGVGYGVSQVITDFDLRKHAEHSGEDFGYHDPETNEKSYSILSSHHLVQIV